jgi:hypothetical protein
MAGVEVNENYFCLSISAFNDRFKKLFASEITLSSTLYFYKCFNVWFIDLLITLLLLSSNTSYVAL